MDPTWSEAKKKAFQNKETNPNQYYYRFNENPNEGKFGKWTEEEDQLLKEQIKQFGPKQWGMLSKSIPGRVGYTCNKRYHDLVAANQLPKNIPTLPVPSLEKITQQPITTFLSKQKKRKVQHELQEDLFQAVQHVLDQHVNPPSQTYSIYEYVWTDQHALFPTPYSIYVGQTSDTLSRRDYQHRSNHANPPYFDRELKTTFQTATIRLVEEKAFDDPVAAKDWMDRQEYYWMKRKRTMRGDHAWGCNSNNARHWEASKAKLLARKLELVEELKALEMVLS